MEDNRFLKKSQNFIIGGFCIGYSRGRIHIRMKIPFAGMAFYQPYKGKHDLYFKIDTVEPDNSGKLLFGSSDFHIPTFLYERENGAFDWLTQNHDGESQLSFRISKDWTEFTLYEDNTGTEGADAFHEFGSLFCYAILNYDACVLHGVVMEYNGMGILVTAASGTGKTTHTRMWRERENALIINGDRCLCRKLDGRWYAYGMPWSGASGEYINRRVPITAIVCLKQAPENAVRRMNPFEGTLAMMQRIFAPVWTGDMQNKGFDLAENLASMIPVLELSCRPDFEAVDVLKEAIENLGEIR